MPDYIASDLDFDEKNSWGTDPLIFKALDNEFKFGLDAAASDKNHKVPFYFTKESNALELDWYQELQRSFDINGFHSENVWVNPPYGRGYIQKFMEKAIEEKAKGVTTVMLVPATLDAQWLPINDISEIRIITGGRLSFIHPVSGKKIAGNTKGSMLVIFSPSSSPLITRYIPRSELISLGTKVINLKDSA